METKIEKAPSAYDYPLLIKSILFAPIVRNPEQEIVYRDSLRLTYAQFHERVRRLASALIALGVKKGDTVAVMDFDSHRYLECYFAIPMIGAVLHTINARLSPEQLIYTISHAEDSVIFVNSEMVPLVEAIRGRIETVKQYIVMTDGGDLPQGNVPFAGEYEALLGAHEPLVDFPDFDENTRATTFYTTGTTGLPKAVYFTHRQLVLHTVSNTASLSSINGGPNFHCGDVYMPITPMFHVHAWGIPYIATFLGVKQVYPGKYVPGVLNGLIQKEKVTFSHCVPTILGMLLRDPSATQVDFTRWKVIIGGAALPKALASAAMDRGIDIFAGYGMSETGPVLSFVRLTKEEAALDREAQVDLRVRTGTPAGLVEFQVVDSQGKVVPQDDRTGGEITVRAPWLTQGYFKDTNNSEKLWEGGWLHTQDVAAVNAQGSLRITDRMKDVIKVGGEWLSSLEIEDVLGTHPMVAECAVIGAPDDKWGEVPMACVIKKAEEELSSHAVVEHLKGYIDKGLLLREAILLKVRFVDAIEKTTVGKVNKVALRERMGKSD